VDQVPLAALDAEWRRLLRRELGTRFRVWRADDRALTRFGDPDALIAFLHRREPPDAKDAVLLALLVRAQHEPLAGRVVLQAMLPGLKGLSARLARSVVSFEELWQILFACLWERIVTYPVERRPSRVAANLLRDTLKRTLAELNREAKAQGHLLSEAPLDQFDDLLATDAASDAEGDGRVDIEGVLRRAVVAGRVTGEEADLILATEVDGVPLAVVAERLGVSYNAVKIRRQRAEQRLLTFLGVLADPSGRSKGHSSVHADDESPHRLLRRLQLIAKS
jgi:DNA-directed RNA polymerase specialized sigma24 family protein